MTKKDEKKQPDKINFEDLGSVFENNLKIYNQYVESFKSFGSGQNNFSSFGSTVANRHHTPVSGRRKY